MLEQLPLLQADPIIATAMAYKADPRPEKIDLGIGVYKTQDGNTPIMQAVRQSASQLVAHQATKAYVGMAGDSHFNQLMVDLLLGSKVDSARVAAVQSAGGAGAIRLLADVLGKIRPGATAWISDPTWPSHFPMMQRAGFNTKPYRYFDTTTQTLVFDRMLEDLQQAQSGDVVILHACCHNPSGADLTLAQWQTVADLIKERGLFAFIDSAYHGLGQGLDADLAGMRLLADTLPEMAIAASCSKNFGLYRDRVGVAILLSDAACQPACLSQLMSANRLVVSMPPAFGAEVVRDILSNDDLRQAWLEELEGMRLAIQGARQRLAQALRSLSNSDRFDFLTQQNGMFSLLGLDDAAIAQLRSKHGIYLVGGGRVNLAGLRDDQAEPLARGLLEVM